MDVWDGSLLFRFRLLVRRGSARAGTTHHPGSGGGLALPAPHRLPAASLTRR